MLDGWKKKDPPTMKKLPIEVDIPEYLVERAMQSEATEGTKATADLTLIAFYYLLRVGEYTCKTKRNSEKQTVQFRIMDVTFFKRDKRGRLKQMDRNASAEEIMKADSCTLKLSNQKNGWRGVCINHHANGDATLCPVKALGRRYIHIKSNKHKPETFLSTYWQKGERHDVTDGDIRKALKFAAGILDYPGMKGIPIDRIDTHSLRGGGANSLSLSGYSDREIQKMGRWKSDTFKEYISSQLSQFSVGMSKSMKKVFNFVNVEGGVYHDVTSTMINEPYSQAAATA